jgi:acyl-[acyl-carrier-protein]-phospholipid O-acyltransferase/long-chain-fatty-acid--[acyl-carrier-protein] ligase
MNKTVVNLSSGLSNEELSNICKALNISTILIYGEDRPLKDITTHTIISDDLRVNPFKSILIALGLFFTPSSFFIRRFLHNTTRPDDIATIVVNANDLSKPVYITHYNILSNTEAFAQLLFMRHNDWVLSEASYQSIVGCVGQLWYPLLNAVGIACTNVDENHLTVSTINALMKQYKITLLISHSEFYRKILNAEQSLTFPNIRFAVAIGTAKDESIYTEFEEKIHVELFEGFGLSELPLVISLNHHNYIEGNVKQIGIKKGSFGKPLPGILANVIDPVTKASLPIGKEGLLIVKGPNIPMNVSTQDGWINTQRRAFIDDEGFLHLISEGNA